MQLNIAQCISTGASHPHCSLLFSLLQRIRAVLGSLDPPDSKYHRCSEAGRCTSLSSVLLTEGILIKGVFKVTMFQCSHKTANYNCIYVCIYVHVYAHMYVCMYVCMYICVYVLHGCMCMYALQVYALHIIS